MTTQNQRLTGIMAAVALLLTMPFIAMQFTREVDWSLMDFAVAAILLTSAGLSCELVLRKFRSKRQRLVMCTAILLALLLLWAELAVGVFGSQIAGS